MFGCAQNTEIRNTDRFPRPMDWRTVHVDRNQVRSGLKTVRMKLETIDIDLGTIRMNEKTIHMNRKMTG